MTPEERASQAFADYLSAAAAGETPDRAAFLAAHADLRAPLERKLKALDDVDAGFSKLRGAAAPEQTLPRPGERWGDYTIVRELGRGGNGVVYLAEQAALKRLVALKVLRLGTGDDKKAVERLHREAETLAKLNHPRLGRIHAFGQEGDSYFLALEYVPGIPLSALIARQKAGATPRPALLARAAADVAEALAYAHARGILHRDVKPSNILLGPDARATLIDFSLTKSAGSLDLTQSADFVGTIYYASPEQAAGDARAVTSATDVYSLGATLYEALTGAKPFDGDSLAEIARKIVETEPPAFGAEVPPDLATIVATCLRKEPARRYASARLLKEDLERWLAGEPILAKQASFISRSFYALRRRPRETLAAVIIAGLVAALAASGLRLRRTVDDLAAEKSMRFLVAGKTEEAVQAAPQYCVAVLERARLSLDRDNNPAKAKADLDAAQALKDCDPARFDAVQGQLLVAQGKMGEARKFLDEAMRRHPRSFGLAYRRGYIEAQKNNRDAAIHFLELARSYQGPATTKSERVALLVELQGLYEGEKAIDALRAAIKESPDEVSLHQLLGMKLMKLKRDDDAETAFKVGLTIDPNSVGIHQGLAIIYAGHGQIDRAIAEWDRIVELGHGDIQVLSMLAGANRFVGNVAKERAALEGVLALDPNKADAKARLAEIRQDRADRGAPEKLRAKLSALKVRGGYVDETRGVGFLPPPGWIRRDVDALSVSFEDPTNSALNKPAFRLYETPTTLTAPTMTTGEDKVDYLAAKFIRWDFPVGKKAFVFICVSPPERLDVIRPLCEAALASIILPTR